MWKCILQCRVIQRVFRRIRSDVDLTNTFSESEDITFEISPINYYLKDKPSLTISITSIDNYDKEAIYEDEWGNYYKTSDLDNSSAHTFFVTTYTRIITIEGTDNKEDIYEILMDNLY